MGDIWLNGTTPGFASLDAVIRSAGLHLVTVDGWQWNSRSSGGFPNPGPMGVVVHHTASPANFENDLYYCSTGHQDAPVGNLLLGPAGEVGLMAGGAANCQGKGGPWHTSRGTVELDNGNARLIAIEACNDGQGMVWPRAQTDAYDALVTALCVAYGFRMDRWEQFGSDVLSHAEWCMPSCPGRKCDPAGPAEGRSWAPGPTGGCSAGNIWIMDRFRADLGGAAPVVDEDEDFVLHVAPEQFSR